MKKTAVILLLLMYGLSVSGLSVNLYFCCGKLSNISLSSNHSCPKPGNQESKTGKGCCGCKTFDSSIKDNYLAKDALINWGKAFQTIQAAPAVTLPAPALPSILFLSQRPYSNPPPLSATHSLLQLYCIYRI